MQTTVIPSQLLQCPIDTGHMVIPTTLPSGQSFDFITICCYFKARHHRLTGEGQIQCPLTRQELTVSIQDLKPNQALLNISRILQLETNTDWCGLSEDAAINFHLFTLFSCEELVRYVYGSFQEILKLKDPQSNETLAHIAARRGLIKTLMALGERCPELLSEPRSDGYTPAHIVATYDRSETLEKLFDLDPQLLSAQLPSGHTPAHIAAGFGHTETLGKLFTLDKSLLSAQTHSGYTPAHIAAAKGHTETSEALKQLFCEIADNGTTLAKGSTKRSADTTVMFMTRKQAELPENKPSDEGGTHRPKRRKTNDTPSATPG